MPIFLTSAQAAAFNAAGEAMIDLGLKMSLSFTKPDLGAEFPRKPFGAHATVHSEHDYVFGTGDTPAEAVRDLLGKYEERMAEPVQLRKPSEVVAAVKGLVEEVRADAADRGPTKVKLDELADRIAALPVKD